MARLAIFLALWSGLFQQVSQGVFQLLYLLHRSHLHRLRRPHPRQLSVRFLHPQMLQLRLILQHLPVLLSSHQVLRPFLAGLAQFLELLLPLWDLSLEPLSVLLDLSLALS